MQKERVWDFNRYNESNLEDFLQFVFYSLYKTLTKPGRSFSISGSPEFGLLCLAVKLFHPLYTKVQYLFVQLNSVYFTSKIYPVHQQRLSLMHITALF